MTVLGMLAGCSLVLEVALAGGAPGLRGSEEDIGEVHAENFPNPTATMGSNPTKLLRSSEPIPVDFMNSTLQQMSSFPTCGAKQRLYCVLNSPKWSLWKCNTKEWGLVESECDTCSAWNGGDGAYACGKTWQASEAPSQGSWTISGSGCSASGNCIQSSNYPSSYSNNEHCTITFSQTYLTVDAFYTEGGYDFLTVGGIRYSGLNGPYSGTYSGSISWSSDYSNVHSGWRLCGFN